jgi:hypothetical protein
MNTLTHETLRYSDESNDSKRRRQEPQGNDPKSFAESRPIRPTGEAYVNKSLSFLSDTNTDRTMAASDYSQGLFLKGYS